MMSRLWLLLPLSIACSPGGDGVSNDRPQREITPDPVTELAPASWDGTRARSGVLVVSDDMNRNFVADPDNGAIQVFRQLDGQTASVELGGEPTRLTRIGDHVFVTLRGSGEVARLRDNRETLELVTRAHVGAEPFDVVASPTEGRIYVSLSMEDAVVALDAETLAPVGRWRVEGEPRWMAIRTDPATGKDQLFIASMRGGKVHRLDTATDVLRSWSLPERPRFDNPRCDDRLLSSRISGEIALHEESGRLYIPAWYADTLIEEPGANNALGDAADASNGPSRPSFGDTGMFFPGLCDDSTTGGSTGNSSPSNEGSAYGIPTPSEQPSSISRFNAALVEMPLDGDAPRVFALGATHTDREVGTRVAVRGVPTALEVFTTGGDLRVVVSLESSSALIAIAPDAETQENSGRFQTAQRVVIPSAAGPSSPRLVESDTGEVRVWSWLDRSLQSWGRFAMEPDEDRPERDPASTRAAPPSELGPDTLAGRRLFFRSDLAQMAAAGSGASCSSCHADGRTDGFTWQFADFPRQTPSLAGVVSRTAPVTWKGDVESVAMEAHLTSSERMGGLGVSLEEAQQIAVYVDGSRRTLTPVPNAEEQELIALGAEVFNRPEVGCAACHSGETGTNNTTVAMFGLAQVNVPGLQGVAATAPYLHDGSSQTLRDLLIRVRDGSMGNTSSLDERELLALETYLRFF